MASSASSITDASHTSPSPSSNSHPEPQPKEEYLDAKTIGSSSNTSTVDLEAPSIDAHKTYTRSFWCLCIAHFGLGLTLFLSTTDTTIVSTSLPTIVDALNAKETQYSWPGIAYLIPQTALQPLFARFSDVLGRKRILYASIALFLLSSILCGFAKNMTWLVLARALGGVGSGGIVSSVWVIASEIVPAEDRSKWSQALSLTWSSSAIAGPLIGGLFSGRSDSLSWRWGFFINLPIGVVGTIILLLSLPTLETKSCPEFIAKRLSHPHPELTCMDMWRLALRFFDFGGMFLLVGGSTCVIIGFNLAASSGWSSPSTCTLLAIGSAMLFVAPFFEIQTKRDALIPPQLFMNKTPVAVLAASFFHNVAFTTGTFFLALYYQAVHGSSPLMAGVRSLPYSLGSSLASMPAAWYISCVTARANKSRKEVMIIGLAISSVGFGLMILLDQSSSTALQEIIPLIAGIGVGLLFHTPFGILTNCMPPEDIASITGAFFLVRFIGSTTGLSIANAIFNLSLQHTLPAGYQLRDYSADALRGLIGIQDPAVRDMVLDAVSVAIQRIWIFCTPCLVIGCLASFAISSAPALPRKEEIASVSEKH